MLQREMHRFDREELKRPNPAAFVDARAIRFQDIDAAGIIFYPRVLEMFHDAYGALLSAAGCPLSEVVRAGEWIAPVRHAEADYFKPLRFGDEVRVEIHRARCHDSEVTLGYRVVRTPGEEVCVVGQVVHTFVDCATFRRTVMPEQLRERLERLESGAAAAG
jgi:1,4-dihydroxy-2-naphthoyl-CoA hydrolase